MQVLLTDDLKYSIFVDLPDVSCPEPPFTIFFEEVLFGFIRILVVAGRNVRTTLIKVTMFN